MSINVLFLSSTLILPKLKYLISTKFMKKYLYIYLELDRYICAQKYEITYIGIDSLTNTGIA